MERWKKNFVQKFVKEWRLWAFNTWQGWKSARSKYEKIFFILVSVNRMSILLIAYLCVIGCKEKSKLLCVPTNERKKNFFSRLTLFCFFILRVTRRISECYDRINVRLISLYLKMSRVHKHNRQTRNDITQVKQFILFLSAEDSRTSDQSIVLCSGCHETSDIYSKIFLFFMQKKKLFSRV